MFDPGSGRCIDIAVDHGFPGESSLLTGIEDMVAAVETLVAAGPDAIQLTVGQAPLLQSRPGRDKPALVLRVDVANVYSREPPSEPSSIVIDEAIGHWAALEDHPVRPRLIGVCDTSPDALAWFDRVDGVRLRTVHHEELLADDDVEVVYIAVPHHLHERLYLDAIAAGKDLLAEKPFGIDLEAATRIVRAQQERPDVFVRCSSEFPFFPGAQLALETARSGSLGELIEVESAFLHSSDVDRSKPINWKRQARYCGEIGVMGDLGMDGGVSFATSEPKAVHRFAIRDGRQVWERVEVGSQSVFPTITGGIFE